VVAYFSKCLLFKIIREKGFESIDTNADNKISKDELRECLVNKGGHHRITNILIDNLFSKADFNNRGFIVKEEIVELSLSFINDIKFHKNHSNTLVKFEDLEEEIYHLLGHRFGDDEIESILERLQEREHDG